MQHTALLPAGTSPLVIVTLWVGETQVALSEKKYLFPSSSRRQLQSPSYCHLPSWCFVVFPRRGFSGADAHLDILEGFLSFPFRVSWQRTSDRISCKKCLLVFVYKSWKLKKLKLLKNKTMLQGQIFNRSFLKQIVGLGWMESLLQVLNCFFPSVHPQFLCDHHLNVRMTGTKSLSWFRQFLTFPVVILPYMLPSPGWKRGQSGGEK